MSEYSFDNIDPAEIKDQALTEKMLVNYADQALVKSVVGVKISDCRHPFIYLPENFADVYKDLPNPPTNVDSIDMNLQYDRASRKFITASARINFDTRYALNFYKIDATHKDRPGLNYAYWLTSPKEDTISERDSTKVMGEAHLNSLMRAVGVTLPQSPQAASWSEITAILQFAGHWSAHASNSAVIDPASTVIVTDRTTGSSMNTATNTLAPAEGLDSRVVTFALDEAAAPAEAPQTTWKLMAKSENPAEPPVLDRLEVIPLVYEYSDMEDFDFPFLLDDPIRKEVAEQSVRLPLTAAYLKAARAAITAASHLL